MTINDLLSKGLEVLELDIKNLRMKASQRKLDADESRNLRDYVELLGELDVSQKKLAASLTPEQAEEMLKSLNAAD